MNTGDVLVLLERRLGHRARLLLPVGPLLKQSKEETIFLYKGSPVTVTDSVSWKDQVFDFLVLKGDVGSSAARVVKKSCCAAHLSGVGTSVCCAHELDAEALRRYGGAWRHA